MSELVQTISHGRVHELRLARPPVNAINPPLCQALREAMEAAIGNGAEGLVLSGGPKVFSAGLDVPLLLSIVMVDFFDTIGTVTAIAETGAYHFLYTNHFFTPERDKLGYRVIARRLLSTPPAAPR